MESFYVGWVARQEQLLSELLAAHRDDPAASHQALVTRVVAHYQEYYREASRVAAIDVLLVLSPSWLTPLERTLLWVGGWHPSLAFRLVGSTVSDALSPEQGRAVEELRRETRVRERNLADGLAQAQEAMASREMVALVSGQPRRNGEFQFHQGPLGEVMARFERLVATADALRASVVTRLRAILTPIQMVDLLAAAAELHLRVRGWRSSPSSP